MAATKLSLPVSDFFFNLSSSPQSPTLFFIKYKCPCRRQFQKPQFPICNVVYTERVSPTKSFLRKEKIDSETDPISILNERIRRDHGTRDGSKPALDSKEADKYIQLVKEQQQRGLEKLKWASKEGKGGKENGGIVSYKVDPYSLKPGDYVVHKKVGVGRFVGIKFDVPKDGSEPIEYVFIEYADGMAKLPVKQAARMLYRYNLIVAKQCQCIPRY